MKISRFRTAPSVRSIPGDHYPETTYAISFHVGRWLAVDLELPFRPRCMA